MLEPVVHPGLPRDARQVEAPDLLLAPGVHRPLHGRAVRGLGEPDHLLAAVVQRAQAVDRAALHQSQAALLARRKPGERARRHREPVRGAQLHAQMPECLLVQAPQQLQAGLTRNRHPSVAHPSLGLHARLERASFGERLARQAGQHSVAKARERKVLDGRANVDRRGGVLATELADLPLARHQPERVPEPCLQALLELWIAGVRLDAIPEEVSHRTPPGGPSRSPRAGRSRASGDRRRPGRRGRPRVASPPRAPPAACR